MSAKLNPESHYALSLVGLALLAAAGVALGALLQSPRAGLAVAAGFALLALYGLVAYGAVYRPLRCLGQLQLKAAEDETSKQHKGLLDSRWMMDRLQGELSRALRRGEPLACAVVEVDDLDRIADRFGREASESVLRSVGNLVVESCRQYDWAGAFGERQFLVILPTAELDDAARAAERLRQRIEASEFACHGQDVNVTVSIGVTQADTERGEDLEQLIDRAKKALANARQEGRNRVSALTTLAMVERAATPPPMPADQ